MNIIVRMRLRDWFIDCVVVIEEPEFLSFKNPQKFYKFIFMFSSTLLFYWETEA